MSTNKNSFFPPVFKVQGSLFQMGWRNNALRNDAIRLGMIIVGPGLTYLYVNSYFGNNPAGTARVMGTPVVNRGFRGFGRAMPWGNDCHLMGNTECHNEHGMWPDTGRLLTFGTSL
uniref:Uncharacterized protein n=1 Tax=Eutreptiella gymnastica TaxID=73025 RepID=A0A7S1JCA6_9EUGL|mmetsp:Transcript_8375/g.14965  ORF Transcript_8375/g.14965 Transcript_8375/m.14965 type:complete len:116 (+) Transcript_8375:51-398(+)